jgi:hypothetical protein
MLIAVSGMVFILLTAMFGVTYNMMTGMPTFHLAPGDDWGNPTVGKPGENNQNVNPMRQYPDWIFLSMILGYFISIGMFTYFWFQYQRWRVTTSERIRGDIDKKNKMEDKTNG